VLAQSVSISTVFSQEPQNKMARHIPGLLMKAFSEGEINAYYPNDLNRKIPLAQFYYHFGERDLAVDALTQSPTWYCNSKTPQPNRLLQDCFSIKFDIANQLTNGKKKPVFIRLTYDATCSPSGISIMGPVFRFSEIAKLNRKTYPIINPQNQAVSYSIADVLQLQLYSSRQRMD
jgi:hypothetical protein